MISWQQRVWSLASNALESVTGVGVIIFVTRIYSTEQTGAWFLFIAIFGTAGALRDALVQSALVKSCMLHDDESRYKALKVNLSVSLFFELCVSFVLFTLGVCLTDAWTSLLLFYPAYSLSNTLYRWQIFYLRSQMNARAVFTTNATGFAVLIVSLACIFLSGLSLRWLVVGLAASSICGVVAVITKIPYQKIFAAKWKKSELQPIRQLGLYAMLREATSSVSSRINLFYANALLSLSATALLGVSQRFAQIALLPNNSIQALLFPLFTKNSHDKVTIKNLYEENLAQLLALTIPTAILGTIVSPWLLPLIAGRSYESGWGVLCVYVGVATIITPFGTAFGSLVTAMSKPNIAFRLVTLNSVLNVSLGFVAMKYIGLAGAPLAYLATEIFGLWRINTLLQRECDIEIANVFIQILRIYKKGFNRITSLTFKPA